MNEITLEQILDYDTENPEECNACGVSDDACPYHEGFNAAVHLIQESISGLMELGRIPNPVLHD